MTVTEQLLFIEAAIILYYNICEHSQVVIHDLNNRLWISYKTVLNY